MDLDPQFAALLNPGSAPDSKQPQTAASAPPAQNGLDPEFQAMLAPPKEAPKQMLPNGQPATGNPDIDNTIINAYKPLSSDAEVGRNLNLGLRNLAQGATGLVTGPLDAIGQAVNFARNPHVPTLQQLNPFSAQGSAVGPGAHDFSADVSGLLDRAGLPKPQNAVERWAGMGQQLLSAPILGGGLFGGPSDIRAITASPVDAAPFGPQSSLDNPQSISAAAASPNIAAASPPLQAAITRATTKNGGIANSDALNRHFEAESLPVKVQLTAGQATQDPIAISKEMNMRGAQPAIAERLNQQNGQLVDNLQAFRDQAGPEVFSTNPVEHGETLIDAYKAKDAAAQAQISAKYKALKDANGGQFPVDARSLLDNASAALHQQLLFDHAPREIMSTLGRLADNNSMTFENYESLRTNLARIQRSMTADGNTKAAAGVIRDAMEQLPLAPGAAQLKPLADSARMAARTQFEALKADPAYNAAVNDTVPPDRFVGRFLVNAPRDDVATMASNLASNPTARQTMGVAALDHLRASARISPEWTGNFSSAGYTKALQALSPKLRSMLDPKTASQLETLGNVARYTQAQPKGSFVNNSNTFVSAAANYGAHALEGAANVAAHGVPIGTWARSGIQRVTQGNQVKQMLAPGAGISNPPPPRGLLNGP